MRCPVLWHVNGATVGPAFSYSGLLWCYGHECAHTSLPTSCVLTLGAFSGHSGGLPGPLRPLPHPHHTLRCGTCRDACESLGHEASRPGALSAQHRPGLLSSCTPASSKDWTGAVCSTWPRLRPRETALAGGGHQQEGQAHLTVLQEEPCPRPAEPSGPLHPPSIKLSVGQSTPPKSLQKHWYHGQGQLRREGAWFGQQSSKQTLPAPQLQPRPGTLWQCFSKPREHAAQPAGLTTLLSRGYHCQHSQVVVGQPCKHSGAAAPECETGLRKDSSTQTRPQQTPLPLKLLTSL